MKKLGFGFMRLPFDGDEVDIDAVKGMVALYMEKGFSYFDTAYKYCGGKSEPALRTSLIDRYPRDSYTLTTKLSSEFMHSKEEQERVFADQFQRLGVESFDYYLLHNVGAVNYAVALELDSFGFMIRQKERGKVKHIGMSYHDNAELLDEILTKHPEIEVVQLQINYLDWENESIQSRKCYEVATKHGKPVIVMEPVKGGTLASVPEEAERVFHTYSPDSSLASWAIRFAASHDNVMMVLSGMSTIEQVRDNTGYMKDFQPLSAEELEITRQAAEIIKASAGIPCTNCRYCTETCPQNIAIPDYFALYQEGNFSTQFAYYFNLAQEHGRAGDCIECSQCETHCPQHIQIMGHLKDVSAKFDGFKGYR